MPRFSILEHDHPYQHWDLFLEVGDSLRTWRLAEEPHLGRTIRALAIANHRLLYLDYEGPVSGARGAVKRWDSGRFTGDALGERRVNVLLEGQRLGGRVTLECDRGSDWRITFVNQRVGKGA